MDVFEDLEARGGAGGLEAEGAGFGEAVVVEDASAGPCGFETAAEVGLGAAGFAGDDDEAEVEGEVVEGGGGVADFGEVEGVGGGGGDDGDLVVEHELEPGVATHAAAGDDHAAEAASGFEGGPEAEEGSEGEGEEEPVFAWFEVGVVVDELPCGEHAVPVVAAVEPCEWWAGGAAGLAEARVVFEWVGLIGAVGRVGFAVCDDHAFGHERAAFGEFLEGIEGEVADAFPVERVSDEDGVEDGAEAVPLGGADGDALLLDAFVAHGIGRGAESGDEVAARGDVGEAFGDLDWLALGASGWGGGGASGSGEGSGFFVRAWGVGAAGFVGHDEASADGGEDEADEELGWGVAPHFFLGDADHGVDEGSACEDEGGDEGDELFVFCGAGAAAEGHEEAEGTDGAEEACDETVP